MVGKGDCVGDCYLRFFLLYDVSLVIGDSVFWWAGKFPLCIYIQYVPVYDWNRRKDSLVELVVYRRLSSVALHHVSQPERTDINFFLFLFFLRSFIIEH